MTKAHDRNAVHPPIRHYEYDLKPYITIPKDAKRMIRALKKTSSLSWISRLLGYHGCGSCQINRMLDGRQKRMKVHSYNKLKERYEIEFGSKKKPNKED